MGIFELIKQASFGAKKLSSTIDGKQYKRGGLARRSWIYNLLEDLGHTLIINGKSSKFLSKEVTKLGFVLWKNNQSLKRLKEGKNEEASATLQVSDNSDRNTDIVKWIGSRY